jgi:hypothetical protein
MKGCLGAAVERVGSQSQIACAPRSCRATRLNAKYRSCYKSYVNKQLSGLDRFCPLTCLWKFKMSCNTRAEILSMAVCRLLGTIACRPAQETACEWPASR